MNIILGALVWFRGSLVAQIGAGVLAFFAAWAINDRLVERRVVKEVVQASKQEGKRRNAKSGTVREEANSPGSNDRLRRDYCRDC